jgi:hypothetical protein
MITVFERRRQDCILLGGEDVEIDTLDRALWRRRRMQFPPVWISKRRNVALHFHKRLLTFVLSQMFIRLTMCLNAAATRVLMNSGIVARTR